MVVVLFDTNIYGKMFADSQGLELVRGIKADTTFVIRNFRLIRNELRHAPKLLPTYDGLVARRIIDDTREMTELAKAYYREYKARGGRQGQKKMMKDFKIVACASLTACDLVFSDDEKTLKHRIARRAFEIVNLEKNQRTPTFLSYSDLKRRFL